MAARKKVGRPRKAEPRKPRICLNLRSDEKARIDDAARRADRATGQWCRLQLLKAADEELGD